MPRGRRRVTEKREAKITVSVTPTDYSNIKTLAEFTHNGKINALIVELIERSIKKNHALIERVDQGKRDYQEILKSAGEEYKVSLIQDKLG